MKALVVLMLVWGAVAAAEHEVRPHDIVSTVVLPKGEVQAAAIIAPSHSLSIRTSEAVEAQLSKQGASPMGISVARGPCASSPICCRIFGV